MQARYNMLLNSVVISHYFLTLQLQAQLILLSSLGFQDGEEMNYLTNGIETGC